MRRMYSKAQIEKIVEDKIGEMPTPEKTKLYNHHITIGNSVSNRQFIDIISTSNTVWNRLDLAQELYKRGAQYADRMCPASGYQTPPGGSKPSIVIGLFSGGSSLNTVLFNPVAQDIRSDIGISTTGFVDLVTEV